MGLIGIQVHCATKLFFAMLSSNGEGAARLFMFTVTLIIDLRCDRGIQTEFQPASKAMDILNAQRLRRPSSPHFTIYQPQLTWIGSIANRVTGVALGVRESFS